MVFDPLRLSENMSSEEQKVQACELLNAFDMNNEYTDRNFDEMLIEIYSHNGYPFMDQFEYIDAVYHNREVENLRKEYFDRKRRKEKTDF